MRGPCRSRCIPIPIWHRPARQRNEFDLYRWEDARSAPPLPLTGQAYNRIAQDHRECLMSREVPVTQRVARSSRNIPNMAYDWAATTVSIASMASASPPHIFAFGRLRRPLVSSDPNPHRPLSRLQRGRSLAAINHNRRPGFFGYRGNPAIRYPAAGLCSAYNPSVPEQTQHTNGGYEPPHP